MRADKRGYSLYHRTAFNEQGRFAPGSKWHRAKPQPLDRALTKAQSKNGWPVPDKQANPVWVGGYLVDSKSLDVRRGNVAGRDVVVLDLDGAKHPSFLSLAQQEEQARRGVPAITDELGKALLDGLPFPAVVSRSYRDYKDHHCYHIFVPLADMARPDQYPGVVDALVKMWRDNLDVDTADVLDKVLDPGASKGIIQQTYLSGKADGTRCHFKWYNGEEEAVRLEDLTFIEAPPSYQEGIPPMEALTPIGSLTRLAPTLQEAVNLINEHNLPGRGLVKMTGPHSACWHTERTGSTYGDPQDHATYPKGTIFFRSSASRVYQAFSSGGAIAKPTGYFIFDVGILGYDRDHRALPRIPMSDPRYLKVVDKWTRDVLASCPELLQQYEDDQDWCAKEQFRRDREATLQVLSERADEKRRGVFAGQAATHYFSDKSVEASMGSTVDEKVEVITLQAHGKEVEEITSDLSREKSSAPRDVDSLLARPDYNPAPLTCDDLITKLNEDLVVTAGYSQKQALAENRLHTSQIRTLATYSPALQYVGLDTRTSTLTYAAPRPVSHPSVLTEMRKVVPTELLGAGGYSDPQKGHIDDAIWQAANERAFNPRLKFLFGLARKAQDNLTAGSTPLLGTACPWQAKPTEYAAAVTRSIALGIAWSQILPGGKKDLFPIICGPQGYGKTSILQSLGLVGMSGSDVRGWRLQLDMLEEHQDAGRVALTFEAMSDNAVAIWDEFSGNFNRRITSDGLKAFISLQGATGTPKYIREPQYYPVSFMPVGTTNKTTFVPAEAGFRRYPVIEVGGWSSLEESYKDTDAWVKGGAPAAQQLIGEAVLYLMQVGKEIGGSRLEAALCREAFPHPLIAEAQDELREASAAIHERMFDEVTKPFYNKGPLAEQHRQVLQRHMKYPEVGVLLRHLAATREANVDGMVDSSTREVRADLADTVPSSDIGDAIEGWAALLGGSVDPTRGVVRVPRGVGQVDPYYNEAGRAV